MNATIYHNPSCSNSRGALALLRGAGVEPTVVEYLKAPPTKAQLKKLLRAAGVSVREAIRDKEPVFAELGLRDPKLSDEALLDAMVANPKLIQRPIVQTAKGVRICRPPETVLELLP